MDDQPRRARGAARSTDEGARGLSGLSAMQKAFLMSVLIATLLIPLRHANNPDAQRALRKTVIQSVGFIALWGLGCAYFYWYIPP
jgi:hypothetical protein